MKLEFEFDDEVLDEGTVDPDDPRLNEPLDVNLDGDAFQEDDSEHVRHGGIKVFHNVPNRIM